MGYGTPLPAVLLTFLVVIAYPVSAQVAESPKDAILILDASGSMWGQIDGVNKIVIAKDVVEGLLLTLPEQQRLGLVAYGHRKKGDCKDIETLADVGADRDKLVSKVRTLSPKGKTPLTASVLHAATELNYQQNAATVILVSDGLETCDADPCELARTLEEKGLDFTVHVVGFDVTAQERKGLQCIAAETGGEFLAADNADELTDALAQVALEGGERKPGEGALAAMPLSLKATILDNGPDIQSKLSWVVTRVGEESPVFEKADTGYATTELVPGDYIAGASWSGWREGGIKTGDKVFTVFASRATVVTVPIDLGIPVTLNSEPTVAEGVPISVSWSGPDDLGTVISVNRPDDGPREHIYFFPTQLSRDAYAKEAEKEGREIDSNGDGQFNQDDLAVAELGSPSQAGEYEVRYILNSPRIILARNPLTVTDTPISLTVPNQVAASSLFPVEWQGTATPGDFVTLVKQGSDRVFTNGVVDRVKAGEAAELRAFAEPGQYEVRYILANDYTTYPGMQHAIQASVPLEIVDVQADMMAPETAVGGSTISVSVSPAEGWEDDYISVVTPGAIKPNRDSRAPLNRSDAPGESVDIRVPAIGGDYELAYFLYPGNRVLVRKPLAIEQAQASVDAPDTVMAGTDFQVNYSGDGFKGDRIIICPENTPDNKMWSWGINYGFAATPGETVGTVRGGHKATTEPGNYEARYVTGLQHVVLARDKFTVIE